MTLCFQRWTVIAVLFGSSVVTAFAQASDAWREGNEQYAAGHFAEASDLYEQLVKSGETSANLFYNLGNAAFRLGDLGRAILHYERALALEPNHPEAQANLRLARDQARALPLRKSWSDRALEWATSKHYVLAAAICFWLAAFSFAAWFLARRRSKALAAVWVLALLLFGGAACAVYALETGATGRELAIVVGKNIEARLATADNAGSVLALPPGSEIKILSRRGEWVYAALPNDARGWIPAQAVERVRL